MYDRIKAWYLSKRWSQAQVEAAAQKGWITTEEMNDILNTQP